MSKPYNRMWTVLGNAAGSGHSAVEHRVVIMASGRSGIAFSLIELIAVMAIIAVLSAVILAAWGPVREAQKRSRTETIINAAISALLLARTDRGSIPAPAEHPFAGTKQPRLGFRGSRNGSWIDVSRDGEALSGVAEAHIEALARDRLMDPEDLFNEPDIPAFYGLKRHEMGIFGAPQANITRCLRLRSAGGVIPSGLPSGYAPPAFTAGYLPFDPIANHASHSAYVTQDGPYPGMDRGNPSFPRDRYLVEGVRTELHKVDNVSSTGSAYRTEYRRLLSGRDETDAVFQAYFSGGILDELRHLGALREPVDDDRLAVAGPGMPPGWYRGAYIAGTPDGMRVWSADPGQDRWSPGCMRASLAGTGPWSRYQLRGLALYDAWGTEILYHTADGKDAILVSAGRDRCFRLRPGLVESNGPTIFATSLATGLPEPIDPDRDGTIDNIRLDTVRK